MNKHPMETYLRRVCEAEAEARRFLARVEAWRKARIDTALWGKENAAMKRASLDLTRALVEVRRSPYKE
jgi:hypothetical protein